MKKTIIICIAILAMYSCAKKITSTTSSPTTDKANVSTVAQATPVSQPKLAEMKTETPVVSSPTEVPIVAEVAATDVTTVKKETAQVIAGKEVFKAKCGRCHDLKEPENYTAVKWVKIIDWMAPKANLDALEKENILAYGSLYAKSGS
jgi:cytochrome c5